MSDNYKYDAALSFLQEDEQLALEIAERLRDRVNINVFVYSERQDELAGADGMDVFSRVFAEESRVVVVLYRETWGKTRWTRIEETAIKNRVFTTGDHDFLLVVPLGKPPKPPAWLPPTRIWVDFNRWGVEGTASQIEARIQQAGGTVRQESVVDAALRLERGINYKVERSNWRGTTRGVHDAAQELKFLFDELHRLAEAINAGTSNVQINARPEGKEHFVLSGRGRSLTFSWSAGAYVNTLDDSSLVVKVWQGSVSPVRGLPKQLQEAYYDADLDLSLRVGWRETVGKKKFITSTQLADMWVKQLLTSMGASGADDDDD